MERSSSQSAFTLIELSIVLVIIGLIVGGVLVGQDLIRAAEIRSTVSQIEKYNSAVNTFRGKYNCLPGDCEEGQAANVGLFSLSGCVSETGCGDGDGLLEDMTVPSQNTACAETTAVWVHLAQASLIDYSPTIPPINTTACPGSTDPTVAIPSAKLGRSNYIIAGSAGGYNYWAIAGLTQFSMMSSSYFFTNALTPIEAYNIDNKIDDGAPNTGIVQARTNRGGGAPAYNPLADLTTYNAGSYAQTPTSGNCLAGGSGLATDPADIYNMNVTNGGSATACELRLRWN